VKTVADTLGIARSSLTAPSRPAKPIGRPSADEGALLADIRLAIAGLPSYGYRRVWAVLRRHCLSDGHPAPNHKRVYRVMKANGLLLQRHSGRGEHRRHDGRVAVDERNTRWCSDAFEVACRDGARVRVAFAMDCCDREVLGHVATTGGVTGEMVCDLMVASAEKRFGRVNCLPRTIEWLSDNGSPYTARDTRRFARDLGLDPVTTPIQSPQSNGMAEALVKTIKRDYARFADLPDARAALAQLPRWFAHYNRLHPHKALGYRSPREFIAARQPSQETPLSDL